MENKLQLTSELISLFEIFLKNKDQEQLIKGLSKLESKVRRSERKIKDAGLWWRFYKNNTMANTIRDLARDLQYPHLSNYDYLIECMKIAIEDPQGVSIYFS